TWLDCSRNRIADLSELRDWLQLKGHDGSIEPQLAGAGGSEGLLYEIRYSESGEAEAHVIGYERPEGVEAAGAVVVPGVIEGCPVVSVDAGF
ncbi:hypothetical protein H6A33_11865, partial [Collinsella tanakaei]|nr:hypothetical protein [Collinsella tanakaei]